MPEYLYLDNAATTFPKPDAVYSYADDVYRTSGGSAGRGLHHFSTTAKACSTRAKSNLLKLYGCPTRKVVFSSSATEALNRIILGSELKQGDNVFITPLEHNAVTRPLNHLVQSIGIKLQIMSFNQDTLLPDIDAIKRQFELAHPSMVIMTHASNVCGAIVPVLEIANIAKAAGAIVVVDMSQTCGLLSLDLSSDTIDFAVFAGHKTLLAPFGIGGFLCLDTSSLKPILFGGNGINSIEQNMPSDIESMSEIGSQNTYAIAGLESSTDWILSQTMESLRKKERLAFERLMELLSGYPNIHLIKKDAQCERVGVVSALFDNYSPDEIEMILDRAGISVRSGLHCAPYAHAFLGTLPAGTVRFSVSALTNQDDLYILSEVLDQIRDS